MERKGGSRIEEAYRRAFPTSSQLFPRAVKAIAGGVTHDARHLLPFPIYVRQAKGSRKQAVDGHELIDYWMGHGALLLGHQHPEVVKAIREQVERGTHYGACHELEVHWAEWVLELVPSAERVRFTMSGTEATQLAIRLARAYTKKAKIMKFEGHFHGWHDYAMTGWKPPYDQPSSSGVPSASLEDILLCPPNDLGEVEAALAGGDVAAVILEPGGGSSGAVPTDPAFLKALRELTKKQGVVLIFDEVITGFRYAPGGAQEYYGVIPDLTALAKILAGGLPGGAVAGKAEILDLLAFRDDPAWNRHGRVAHQGTFNANPLSAAAGVATLTLIADGEAQRRAARAGRLLREGIDEVIKRVGVDAWVYGEASLFHLYLQPSRLGLRRESPDHRVLLSYDLNLYHQLRCALLLWGVDVHPFHGWISAVHSDEDLEKTIEAFEKALRMLQTEGLLQ